MPHPKWAKRHPKKYNVPCILIIYRQSSYLRQWLITSIGVSRILKNCRCFTVQERLPLWKAFTSEIFFEMQKKIKDGCYSLYYTLFLMLGLSCRSYLLKMRFNVIFLQKRGKIEKTVMIDPLEKLSFKIWGDFRFLHLPLWFLSTIHVKLPIHFFLLICICRI